MRIFPERLAFYDDCQALRNICERMREEILKSIPESEVKTWEGKEWSASVRYSDSSSPSDLTLRQHVHRDQIVASLTLEGKGTVAKIPMKDISQMSPTHIIKEADDMSGFTYQADAGHLMIINGVHYPGGGLHAAPQTDGVSHSRLTILIEISER